MKNGKMEIGDRFEDCDYDTDTDELSEIHLYEVVKVWVDKDGWEHFEAEDLGPTPDGFESNIPSKVKSKNIPSREEA